MSMIATDHAGFAVEGFSPRHLIGRLKAALARAEARAKLRHDYRQLLDRGDAGDVGITQDDVRHALRGVDGR